MILHERCHIVEHSHSDRFYRLTGQVMSEWEVVKTQLDEMAGVIFSAL
ncbi:YgjP-like metallopeptidase domain-containing protein [Citrobacter sp. OP27]